MAAPIVQLPGLIQITPLYSPDPDTGNHPRNILWFVQRAPGSLTQANLTTIGNAFDAAWQPVWTAYGATGQNYVGSITTDFSSTLGLSWDTRGHYTPHDGGNNESLPPNTAMLISLKTSERYRGGHARIYLPYVGRGAQSTSDPSAVNPAFVTLLTTNFGTVEPAMNAIGVGGGLSQRVYRHRTNAALATLMPITTYNVQPMMATQRRRLRKSPHH